MLKSCNSSHLPYCFSALSHSYLTVEFLLTAILILSTRSYCSSFGKNFPIILSGISFVVNIILSSFSPEGYPSITVTHPVSTPPPHNRSPTSVEIEKNHRSPASAYVAPSTSATSSL